MVAGRNGRPTGSSERWIETALNRSCLTDPCTESARGTNVVWLGSTENFEIFKETEGKRRVNDVFDNEVLS